MIEAQQPAVGILKGKDFDSASNYIFSCDCHSTDHQVNMWIEVDSDDEFKMINVSFFTTAFTDCWSKSNNRFKLIWQLLTTGYIKTESHFILSEQAAINFAQVILDDIKKFKSKGN